MKKCCLLFSLFIALLSNLLVVQGQSLRTIEYYVFESGIYHPGDQMVYAAAIDGGGQKYANKLLKIDPAWGAVREEIEVGFDPRFVRTTSNRKYLFFTAEQPRRIKRFDPATQKIDQDYALGLKEGTQLRNIYTLPQQTEAVLLLSQDWDRDMYELSILDHGQYLPYGVQLSSAEGYAISSGFQNDSTFWVLSPAAGNIIKFKIRSNGIFREQTYPGYKGAINGNFYFTGTHFISNTGIYVSLDGDSPRFEDRLPISLNSAIGIDPDLPYIYVLEPLGFTSAQIRKLNKTTFQEEKRWQLPIYLSTYPANNFLICGENRFIFTTTNIEFFWDCQSKVKQPQIVGKANGVYCLPQDLGYTLKTQEPAPELFWQRENETGVYAPELKVIQSGIYRVKASDSEGCQTAFSAPYGVGLQDPSPRADITNSIRASFPITVCSDQEVKLQTSTFIKVDHFEWSTGDTSAQIEVKDAGLFRVRVRPAGGCWSAWSDTVRVNRVKESFPAQPTISIVNAQSNIFCSGDTIVLQATPGYKYYFWSLSSAQSQGNQLKISLNSMIEFGVNLYVAHAMHCVSEHSEPVILRYIAPPAKPSIQRSGNILVSSSADPAIIHTWYRNGVLLPGESKRYLTVNREGFYTNQVSYGACSSLPSDLFSFTGITTAQKEPNAVQEVYIYPNPTTNDLYIQNLSFDPKSLQLLDIQGRRIKIPNLEKAEDHYHLDISALPSGVYFLRGIVLEKWKSWRFVKL